MKNKVKKIYLYFRAIPKTIFFNFKYFHFRQAIKLPIVVSHRTLLLSTGGRLDIKSENVRTGMIKIGFGDVGIFDQQKSRSIWQVDGSVIFNGEALVGHGSKISVAPNAELCLGNNFKITAESSILCHKRIKIGNNCLLSWDILIMDTDFHKIKNSKGETINHNREIIIGDNVWIGCRSLILKGTKIENGCVIAANTTITKTFSGRNNILGGDPAHILKENITWEL